MKQQNRFPWLLLTALLAVLLAGCGQQNTPANSQDDTLSDEPPTPVSRLKIENACQFSIEYLADGVKLVLDSCGRELLLVPQGVSAPEGYENALRVSTPVQRIMVTSPPSVGFLDALESDEASRSLAVLTWDGSPYTTPALDEGFASGQITYISPETWAEGDIEMLVAAELDLVFLDTFSADTALAALLDQAGIPYVVAAAWNVQNPAQASVSESYLEWIKFFAAFYNLDEEADRFYQAQLERLDALYAEAASIPEKRRPVVAVVSDYDGAVTVPAGDSVIASLLEKAGAVYALADEVDGAATRQVELEEFLERYKDVDVLIFASGDLLDAVPQFMECKAYQNSRVFAMDEDYHRKKAQAVDEFADLTAICHPELNEGYSLTMYHSLIQPAG